MVAVQHDFPPLTGEDKADIQRWLAVLSEVYAPAALDSIRRACEFAAPLYHGQATLAGTPLLSHALGAAGILTALRLDYETIAAALLHAVPDHLADWQPSLTEHFGASVAALVAGISRMERIRLFSEAQPAAGKEEEALQIESLRKMLLAMVEDIRVVLIKLAERTQTLRSLSQADADTRKRIAQETRSIFAPLANRLGVWQIKWELEDLSVRFLEPDLYKQVAKLLDERRLDRERYIADVVERLQQALDAAGIAGKVTGRPKHIYSIINKMKRKRIAFGDLYDVRAVRIMVGGETRQATSSAEATPADAARLPPSSNETSATGEIGQCYAALSVVHELWPAISSEFDDYIANPKPNGYRSLHTAVTGPRGLAVEVQIRTRDMHHDSELGVAAHWRYKENKKSDAGFDEKISWLRQILAWKTELADSGSLQQQFRNELLQDRVYVFTPQGKVIDLPKGATPVDFAYALHTDLGHRTRGAKVDGAIVPLKYPLQNGQRVEILTAKQGGPSRDWLSAQLGYLKSTRARAKVRHWFKTQNLDDSIAQGRQLFDRELQRLGASAVNQERVAQRLGFHRLEELLAALGRGDLTPRRAGLAVRQDAPQRHAAATTPKPVAPRASANGVLVAGVDNLMIKMARCCKPQKPAAIVAYVTRDRGITIHRSDCACLQRVPQDRRDRLLDAVWS